MDISDRDQQQTDIRNTSNNNREITKNMEDDNAMDIDNNSSSDDDEMQLSKQISKSPTPPSSTNHNHNNTTTNTNNHKSSNNDKLNNNNNTELDVEITVEDYESIAIMIDELVKEDPAVRIKAIRSLPIIAKALGEGRTRNELIPYITQMIDDDDEVLLVLIEEIYRLFQLKLIGGTEYCYCLIPPFERLCQVEEKIIRDEATIKFGKIIQLIDYHKLHNYFDEYVFPLLKRLCDCDWHTARISGATLIANAFSKFVTLLNTYDESNNENNESKNENDQENDKEMDIDDVDANNNENCNTIGRLKKYKSEMLTLMKELSGDSIPVVRRSAIISIGKMVSVLKSDTEVISDYLPLLKALCSDDQDNVRVFSVFSLMQFSHVLSHTQVKDHLLYLMRRLATDSAWRVRYICADNFIELCSMLDSQTISESMINYFMKLLCDQEAEVRAVAISKMAGISKLIGVDLSISKLIPIICDKLINDSNKYARASLASVIIPFCYLLPNEIVISHIVSCILKILRDEFANVRLHVITHICDDSNVNNKSDKSDSNGSDFDISLLQESIIPSIMELTLDNDWRVRLGIIDKLPALARQFGYDFFNEKLFDLCLASLEDNVSDIRLSAATNLCKIAKIFMDTHDGWVNKELLPKLIEKVHSSKHYLHRTIYLVAFQYLCVECNKNNKNNSICETIIKEIVFFMENDKVPNVRFKACQIITFLMKNQIAIGDDREMKANIIEKIEYRIQSDHDSDVVFFAQRSLDSLLGNS